METRQQNILLLALTAVLVLASLWLFLPPRGADFIEYRDSTGSVQKVELARDGATLPPEGVGATGTAPVSIEAKEGSPSGWALVPSAESTAATGAAGPRDLEFDDSFPLGGITYALRPGPSKITQGLDIRGGLSVILTAEDTDTVTAADMERAETIVKTRVDSLGVREASVQRQGNDALLVQIPGIKDPQEALDILGSTGQLEFVEVAAINDSETISVLQAGPGEDGEYRRADGSILLLKEGTYQPFMTGEVVTNAVVDQDESGQIVVNIDMNAAGAQTWGQVTSRLAPTRAQVAIVLDGVVKSAPSVNEPILAGSTSISGTFTPEEAKALKTVLETGALPVSLKFSEARSVGPTLGQDSLRQGIMALVVGFSIVLIYILAFYRGLGILTAGAMLVFASFFISILQLKRFPSHLFINVFNIKIPESFHVCINNYRYQVISNHSFTKYVKKMLSRQPSIFPCFSNN